MRSLAADVFAGDPYEFLLAANGAEGLAAFDAHQPDLVICDIHLPDMLGLDICRIIKQRNPQQLFAFLTGDGETLDQVVGLELGADEYFVKPVALKVFRARVRALLRRIQPLRALPEPEVLPRAGSEHQLVQVGQLTIDLTAYQAFFTQEALNLTHKEFELLALLATHPGQLFTRQQLLDHIWQDNLDVNERSVDALVRRLRSKLHEDGENPQYIETLRGTGYRFRLG